MAAATCRGMARHGKAAGQSLTAVLMGVVMLVAGAGLHDVALPCSSCCENVSFLECQCIRAWWHGCRPFGQMFRGH
ncbi:hypothetical protein HaLaN_28947 [Haematococcus lacustris]|uniref:Uncharacterized protein n=1 Tax=Haematococcus lacustris TaxID=44745 RepID=A0A6A0AD16_HAELA|nr:hypothetical protein HaLaN_28947 [Haematococcus lacustris]